MNSPTVVPSESRPVATAIRQHPSADVAARSPGARTAARGVRPMNLAAPHDPASCAGRGCSRHHPSAHHMRAWPRIWREFYGYSDRLCAHGVGHPDPDDVVHLQSLGGVRTTHPCDGCCIAPLEGAR